MAFDDLTHFDHVRCCYFSSNIFFVGGLQGARARKARKPDYNRAKKSLNAFQYYDRAERQKTKAENPDLNSIEVSQELVRRWGSLSDDDKQVFYKVKKV